MHKLVIVICLLLKDFQRKTWFVLQTHFTTGAVAVALGPLVKCGENIANQFESQPRSFAERPL